jgi:nicotinate-nucleotide pyrophosphorylase (carboxylating)
MQGCVQENQQVTIYNKTVHDFIISALREDIGTGDITSELSIPHDHESEAVLLAKDDFILAGLPFVREVFSIISNEIIFEEILSDGNRVEWGETIARLKGRTRGLLMGERLALNILQRLSGIATLTRKFVDVLKETDVRIADTRKTTPGMRYLEKYAVRVGGGLNHRFALYDGILIKDNHIKAAGGIRRAVERIKRGAHHLMKIEVEVKNIEELREALDTGVDVIMLDNMSPPTIREAVTIARAATPSPLIEASGGINIDNVLDFARTGVDLISLGVLTHSAPAVDISMEIT